MATKENYKRLQETLSQFEGQNKALADIIQKVEAAKKDKESKQSLETLNDQLKNALQNVKQLEKELAEVQDGVTTKLGRKATEPRVRAMPGIRGILQKRNQILMRQIQTVKLSQRPRSRSSKERKKPLDPDEQELAYELKSQLLKNVVMQNEKLKTEFTLHEKLTESRLLSQQNRRLHEDITLSRANSLKLIKMFERKAKEADVKLKEITSELQRSHELAEKYRNLYELERRKGGKEGEHLPPVVDDDRPPTTQPQTSYSFLGGNVRINDVIRKNEVLVEENMEVKREVRRLKEDNAKLIKQTKQAMADRDQILHKLETSESNRRTLLKRLEKEKGQHQLLSRSLTRQASDWILLKKQIAQFDEEYRWSQVDTLNPQKAEERLQAHPVTKNVYMPRKMFPVDQYDKAQPTHH